MNARFTGNLELKKTAVQSSTRLVSSADLAVDGLRGSQSCSYETDVNPWWSVDLGEAYDIGHVVVTAGYGITVVELALFINSLAH